MIILSISLTSFIRTIPFQEHSLNSYDLAATLGADYSEPDLVLTKDGAFIAIHDVILVRLEYHYKMHFKP